MNRRQLFLLICLFGVTAPAFAQTTTGGTTGSTGGTTTGGSSTGGGGGGSTVSSSGSGTASRAGATTGNGSGGPFSGTVPSGFNGGNAASTATNSATGAAAGTASVPGANNPWRTTYGNPYAIGQSVMGGTTAGKTGAAAKGFGQPIYTTSTTNVGVTGLNQNSSNSGAGFNNMNLSKSPRYTTALGEDIALPTHSPAQLQAKVQDILARSSQIRDGRQIRVVVDGDRVFLVGNVGSERERRIAESMIRLTPGVGDVENRLALSGQP
ncbi:MAG: BON domain-containing protein [Planctomycetota bacterium]